MKTSTLKGPVNTPVCHVLMVACATILVACGSPSADWLNATRVNTADAYQHFMERNPMDPRAVDATRAIVHLKDEAAWNRAQVASDVDGYREYLKAHPQGEHAPAARANILDRERSWAWTLLEGRKTQENLKAFLAKYPAGPESDGARAELQTKTGYRAEFATATDRNAATRRRNQIVRRLKQVAPKVVIVAPDDQSDRYRVASVPMSEKEANALCDRTTAVGQACWIISTSG